MAISYLSAINFNGIPGVAFVVQQGTDETAVPTPVQGQLFYKSTSQQLMYYNGTAWVSLGAAGAGAPPSGAAGGDLAGSYPNPTIKPGVIVDADVSATAAIQQSKIANLTADLDSKVPWSRQVNAGDGLTGGGNLSGDQMLNVNPGPGLMVDGSNQLVPNYTVLDLFYQRTSQKGAANGYAPLDANSLIPTAHLPPLAINEVFTVASQAAMLALTAQRGDMAIRTDITKTYVLSTDSPGTLADWKEVMAGGQVVSVNGQTGTVVIDATSLGVVPNARQVVAGNGLTGGGALSGNVTLNVVGDANLSVTADQVAVLSAPKWTTARTLSLTGDVTGSASIDGSGNVSLAATVVGGTSLAKHYAGNVPAGTAPVITHSLGSRDVTVEVYRNSAPYDTVMCDVERTSTTQVTLKFASAVTANAYRVVVTGR